MALILRIGNAPLQYCGRSLDTDAFLGGARHRLGLSEARNSPVSPGERPVVERLGGGVSRPCGSCHASNHVRRGVDRCWRLATGRENAAAQGARRTRPLHLARRGYWRASDKPSVRRPPQKCNQCPKSVRNTCKGPLPIRRMSAINAGHRSPPESRLPQPEPDFVCRITTKKASPARMPNARNIPSTTANSAGLDASRTLSPEESTF